MPFRGMLFAPSRWWGWPPHRHRQEFAFRRPFLTRGRKCSGCSDSGLEMQPSGKGPISFPLWGAGRDFRWEVGALQSLGQGPIQVWSTAHPSSVLPISSSVWVKLQSYGCVGVKADHRRGPVGADSCWQRRRCCDGCPCGHQQLFGLFCAQCPTCPNFFPSLIRPLLLLSAQ